MIIDAHTHIYPDAVAKKAIPAVIQKANGELTAYTDGTFNGLLDSMNRCGVDYSLTQTIATSIDQGKKIIKWIESSKNLSKRILFFGSIHPYDPDFRLLIKEYKSIGIQGLKLHPPYQNFPADSRKIYPFYEEVIKNDLILHFHSGYDMSVPDSDDSSVKRMAHFLKDFKGAKVILAHGGDQRNWEIVRDFILKYDCYYDTSFALEKMLSDPHARKLLKEKNDFFVFGTDSPWRDQKHYIQLIRNSDLFTQEEQEKIFYKNILKLIRLD